MSFACKSSLNENVFSLCSLACKSLKENVFSLCLFECNSLKENVFSVFSCMQETEENVFSPSSLVEWLRLVGSLKSYVSFAKEPLKETIFCKRVLYF